MQPNLTLRNGQIIPLPDETYEMVLRIVQNGTSSIEPAETIEDLESEFAELFSSAGVTVDDLRAEHDEESARERRKLANFD